MFNPVSPPPPPERSGHVSEDAHNALAARVNELEAEVRNLRMMVQGLGFTGLRGTTRDNTGFTHPTDLMAGGTVGIVTTKEVTDQ